MQISSHDLNKFSVISAADNTSKTAAEELKYYLTKYYGYEPKEVEPFVIRIGCPQEREIALAENRLVNDDSFAIITGDESLDIFGKTPEGTIYGVYHFLNLLGIDWLTPDQEYFYGKQNINFKETLFYNFSSQIRIDFTHGMKDAKFRTRQRIKYTFGEINAHKKFADVRGVEYAFGDGWFGHTFEILLPYEKYFQTHPEYFSFADGYYGEKYASQRCLSNPDVFRIILNGVLEYLEKHPKCNIFSVSQNDSYADYENNYCTCEKCKAFIEQEGVAGVYIDFINRIAAEVEKRFPNVLIHTFAYQFTRTPPKTIKPRKNVLVQICAKKPFNRTLVDTTDSSCIEEKEYFDGWRAITSRLHVWAYWCSFEEYFLPLANFRSLYEDTVYYLRSGVYGIFQQQNYDDFPFEFYELRGYLVAKLFQNPWMSFEEYKSYMRKFIRGYYGEKSGKRIYEYLWLLEDVYAKEDALQVNLADMIKPLINGELIRQANDLWEDAERLADCDVYLSRIQRSRASFDFAELCYLYDRIGKAGESKKIYVEKRKKLIERAFYCKNELVYKESKRIKDLSKFDYATPPFVYRNVTKTIEIPSQGFSTTHFSDENTNSEIRGFSFDFKVKKEKNGLDFIINVQKGGETSCLENILLLTLTKTVTTEEKE